MSTTFAEGLDGREPLTMPLRAAEAERVVAGRRRSGQCRGADFHDLNLDQIVHSITAGRDEYDLTPFFVRRLETADDINFRHEVFRDVEDAGVRTALESFAQSMRRMREQISQANRLHYLRQGEAWFLDAVQTYCSATAALSAGLIAAKTASCSLTMFTAYLSGYVGSAAFRSLESEAVDIKPGLAQVAYTVTIRGTRVAGGELWS